ncbi:hypothetical protein ACEQPO_31440 [Bacillus sp. SL00103]
MASGSLFSVDGVSSSIDVGLCAICGEPLEKSADYLKAVEGQGKKMSGFLEYYFNFFKECMSLLATADGNTSINGQEGRTDGHEMTLLVLCSSVCLFFNPTIFVRG